MVVVSVLVWRASLYANLGSLCLKRLHVVARVKTGCRRLSLVMTVVGCRLNIWATVLRTRVLGMAFALKARMNSLMGRVMLTVQVIRILYCPVRFVVMMPPVI